MRTRILRLQRGALSGSAEVTTSEEEGGTAEKLLTTSRGWARHKRKIQFHF